MARAVPLTFPRTSRALREALEVRGIRPDKGRGQHFLTDPQAVDAIVRDAGVTTPDHVIEVGTGPGLLTHALAETGARVTTFEIDPAIQSVALGLRDWPDRVAFRLGDVLESKHRLSPDFVRALGEAPEAGGHRRLVSNLPYGAGTPILLGVAGLDAGPETMTVMLQDEVATKLVAAAGTRTYGAPSAILAARWGGRRVRRFGPEVFWPRPRVRSAVLALKPLEAPLVGEGDYPAYASFVTGLFAHRRKMLPSAIGFVRGDLERTRIDQALEAAGIDGRSRVEACGADRLLALWQALP